LYVKFRRVGIMRKEEFLRVWSNTLRRGGRVSHTQLIIRKEKKKPSYRVSQKKREERTKRREHKALN